MSPASVCPPAEPLVNGCKSSGNDVYGNRRGDHSPCTRGLRNSAWANQIEYHQDVRGFPRRLITRPSPRSCGCNPGTSDHSGNMLRSQSGGEILSYHPIGTRTGWRYRCKSTFRHGLPIRDVKGAELNLVSHECDDIPSCVGDPYLPVFHSQNEGIRPDDEQRYSDIGAVIGTNSVINY